jgi:SAM-dependent MidA family methyltransferase
MPSQDAALKPRHPTSAAAAAAISRAIADAGGAIPFDEFMRLALYGEGGFYRSGGTAGRRGDFITSPEVGPLFGVLLGRQLDAEWERLGRPDVFTVVDVGAGRGTMARSLRAAHPACSAAMRYVTVELSPALREQHPDWVESRATMPDEPIVGVVVANELLDNLPFRLAVYDGGWREAYVVDEGGDLREVLSAPLEPVPSVLPARPSHGARAPLLDGAVAWLAEARRLVAAGSVLVVDYAVPTTAELAARPWREWLRTYRGHGRGGHYLAAPGTQDVTVDVPLDQLPEPDTVRTQAQFLQRWGIDELVEEGRRHWAAEAARPDVAALRMRSRIREAEALLDPSGFGAFTVAEWRAGP